MTRLSWRWGDGVTFSGWPMTESTSLDRRPFRGDRRPPGFDVPGLSSRRVGRLPRRPGQGHTGEKLVIRSEKAAAATSARAHLVNRDLIFVGATRSAHRHRRARASMAIGAHGARVVLFGLALGRAPGSPWRLRHQPSVATRGFAPGCPGADVARRADPGPGAVPRQGRRRSATALQVGEATWSRRLAELSSGVSGPTRVAQLEGRAKGYEGGRRRGPPLPASPADT